VARRRRAERVDRLEVVADRGDVAAAQGEAVDDRDLQSVDVLVLVHEHVVERRGDVCAGVLVAHERSPQDEQIVEIDRAEGALARGERLEERPEDVEVLLAPREAPGHDVAQRSLRVHGA
jgi:hypothetical protein